MILEVFYFCYCIFGGKLMGYFLGVGFRSFVWDKLISIMIKLNIVIYLKSGLVCKFFILFFF